MSASIKPKVLALNKVNFAHDAWQSLSQVAEIIEPKASTRSELMSECQSGAFDGAVAVYRSFSSFKVTGRLDEELIGALPRSVKFIVHCGAGYDQIDIPACTARSIRVSNTPTAVDDATADIAVWLLLGAMRNLNAAIFALREGRWRGDPAPALGHDPRGKVLGILGMGGIGRNMAVKMRAFGMSVRYHNRTKLAPELEDGAEYVSLETLLRESDVLSVNLPLSPTTHHFISRREFELMKPGIVLVNTARGAVIDEAALVEALDSGVVASAGLDVFEHEPQIHPGLLANPNVMLAPHMGTNTIETETKMEEWAISNARLAVTEGRLRSIVSDQKHLE